MSTDETYRFVFTDLDDPSEVREVEADSIEFALCEFIDIMEDTLVEEVENGNIEFEPAGKNKWIVRSKSSLGIGPFNARVQRKSRGAVYGLFGEPDVKYPG